jgi:acyl-CoA dehydrogenase
VDGQVHTQALTNYFEVSRFCGLDPFAMLRRFRISPAILEDPDATLPSNSVADLLEASADESGCESFGLLMAECRRLSNLGPLSLLLAHQGTARDVLEAMVEYQGVLNEVMTLDIEEAPQADGEALAIIRGGFVTGYDGRQAIELLMAIVCRTVSEVVGGRWHPDLAYFRHAAPADTAHHMRVFQCPLVFDADFNGLVCTGAALDAPNPAAESAMARHARRYLDTLVPAPADGSMTERARRSLYLLLPAGRATLEQVGANLGQHPRALQRQLEREGRTFATLLAEVRRELALRYLANPAHSIGAVAQMTAGSPRSSACRRRSGGLRNGRKRPSVQHWRETVISGSESRYPHSGKRRGSSGMDFDLTERQAFYRDRVRAFIDSHIRPRTGDYKSQLNEGDRWQPLPVIEELKPVAKAAGLWNLFMPPGQALRHVDESFAFEGTQLTNLEYALCAEEMGRIPWSSEVFNCSAPDTGNMEVLHRYGTREQKEEWLRPLMNGEIRSAFLMTEPAVASSDATNIECDIARDGADYVINGRKWWSSGAGDPRCKVAILMGKTDREADKHRQQSMVLMPLNAPGVNVLRHLTVYGYDDAPHGHMEILLENVRVPVSAMLLGEGRGFEIAQGRLGPGRIHHCMRTIGAAEEALAAMVIRLQSRVAFGKKLIEHSIWEQRVARARIDIDMSRLLCLKAADLMDKAGNKAAAAEIAMIKVYAPNMALQIIDDAVQAHGGAGVSQDFGLASSWAGIRTLRLADGPDEVHNRAIARIEFAKHRPQE